MIFIKTKEEIKIMREGGRILAEILQELEKAVKPGITTQNLEELAGKLIASRGALSAFKDFQEYPAALCTSVNEEVVHALPSERVLKEGDIIGLDLGIIYPPEKCGGCPFAQKCSETPGMYTDMAVTVGVGKISDEAQKIINVAKKALDVGIAEIKEGAHLGDISYAIQFYVEKEGFSVIRDLCGHGIGKELHEEPQILNFGKKGRGPVLKEGMVLALEPMISAGHYGIKKSADGFGFETKDKSLAAHFEHTVAITKKGSQILTIF